MYWFYFFVVYSKTLSVYRAEQLHDSNIELEWMCKEGVVGDDWDILSKICLEGLKNY
jgi:hypothetical protein